MQAGTHAYCTRVWLCNLGVHQNHCEALTQLSQRKDLENQGVHLKSWYSRTQKKSPIQAIFQAQVQFVATHLHVLCESSHWNLGARVPQENLTVAKWAVSRLVVWTADNFFRPKPSAEIWKSTAISKLTHSVSFTSNPSGLSCPIDNHLRWM